MYFKEIKQKAIRLRQKGYSYSYIVKHVPVAKSTLSEWLNDVPFVPNHYTLKMIGNARLASGAYKHHIRLDSLKKAELQARKYIGMLSDRDIAMLGIGVYIGEGGKTNGMTRIINSDPKVIKLVIKWLGGSFGINSNQIKIRLYIYPDNREKDCIEHWSEQTGVPVSQFFKSTVDYRTDKKLRNKGKLPFGTAHMSVKSLGNKDHGIYLHRLIMAAIHKVLC